MCCSCIQGTWIKITAQRLHRIRNSVSMDADVRAFMFQIGLADRKAFLWAFFGAKNRKLSLQTVQTNRRDKVWPVSQLHPILLNSIALHVI